MADRPPRFITPEGFARIRAEYEELFGAEPGTCVVTASAVGRPGVSLQGIRRLGV